MRNCFHIKNCKTTIICELRFGIAVLKNLRLLKSVWEVVMSFSIVWGQEDACSVFLDVFVLISQPSELGLNIIVRLLNLKPSSSGSRDWVWGSKVIKICRTFFRFDVHFSSGGRKHAPLSRSTAENSSKYSSRIWKQILGEKRLSKISLNNKFERTVVVSTGFYTLSRISESGWIIYLYFSSAAHDGFLRFTFESETCQPFYGYVVIWHFVQIRN